jgi:hypothetical protein
MSEKMPSAIPLREVPGRFLDQQQWAEVRQLTSSEMEALCSLNAAYPDGAHDFFWKRGRSDAEARRCYRLGKAMLEDCRSKLIAGELLATGERRSGIREEIPGTLWSSLYPMFFTNTARGRTRVFKNVEVRHNELIDAEVKLNECVAWLRQRQLEGITAKKVLRHQAAERFAGITSRTFDLAYAKVLRRKQGRPPVRH